MLPFINHRLATPSLHSPPPRLTPRPLLCQHHLYLNHPPILSHLIFRLSWIIFWRANGFVRRKSRTTSKMWLSSTRQGMRICSIARAMCNLGERHKGNILTSQKNRHTHAYRCIIFRYIYTDTIIEPETIHVYSSQSASPSPTPPFLPHFVSMNIVLHFAIKFNSSYIYFQNDLYIFSLIITEPLIGLNYVLYLWLILFK